MHRMLLAGFAPFADLLENPSWQAADAVARQGVTGVELQALRMPVSFRRAPAVLRDAISQYRPDAVIALGIAIGRHQVTPEEVAVNLTDARIPDADGAQPRDMPIDVHGPATYASTLPVSQIITAIRATSIDAALSTSAGGYVCNNLFYRLQQMCAGTPVRSGFIHVPATEASGAGDQVPTMSLNDVIAAVRISVELTIASGLGAPAARVGSTP